MKQLWMLLFMTSCAPTLQGMGAQVNVKPQPQQRLMSRAARRLEIGRCYAELKVELAKFNALPPEQQTRDKEALLKKTDALFAEIIKLEKNFVTQNMHERAQRIQFFKDRLKEGDVNLEAFDKIAAMSFIARAGIAPEEGKRNAGAGVESKRSADAQQSAPAERTTADKADEKIGAAQREEARAQDDKKRRDAQQRAAAEQLEGSRIGEGSSDPSALRVLGELGATGVASRAAWVLASSNPYIAGALAAREVYRAGKFFLWMAEEGEKIQAEEARKKAGQS